MADALNITAALICAYFIGSLPTGYLVARLSRGIDIRQVGSRNMGAMNVFYQVGFWYGLLVLVVDIGKGVAAVALARFLELPPIMELVCGAVVVLGHGYTVFLRFRGGKGGATAIGVLIFLMPWGIPIYLAIFGLMMLGTRFPTLSYSVAFLCFPFVGGLIYDSREYVIFTIALLLIPSVKYIPRVKEMYTSGGSWRRVFLRRGVKDRF